MHYRSDGEITALALALIANGEPQETVARETGISSQNLSRYKNGSRELPPRAARSLAHYLQLPETVIANTRVSAAWLYAVLERLASASLPMADGK